MAGRGGSERDGAARCYVAAVRRVSRSASPTPLNLEADTTLIFALQEVRVSADGGTFRLSRADAARFSRPARCALSGAAGAAQCYVIEIQRA